MYASCIHPKSDTSPQNSGSESTPLISSESRTSLEPTLFDDSETTDLDLNSAGCSLKYGSANVSNYRITLNARSKRTNTLRPENELLISTTENSLNSIRFVDERSYNVRNANLILTNENGYITIKKEMDLSSGSLQSQPNVMQTSCNDFKPKQSSLVTIFSIWNTILGSSMLTMPWGIAMAGFFPGIIIILVMSGLCLYTAYRLLSVHAYHGGGENIEVVDLSRIYLNKWAEYIAKIFSITVLLGATIAYWVLMANFLYNCVNFIYDNINNWSKYSVPQNISYSEVLCPKQEIYNDSTARTTYEKTFDALGPAWDLHKTVPVFLAILIFPLLNFNSTTFFTKFNSLGTISIVYLIIFVMIKSISWGINMDQIEWHMSWIIRPTFPALTGMLALSFFIHNIIITIMQNNRNQEKNGRDLTIAYILVTLTYIIIGAAFFICFPLSKSCIEDNLLNNFQKWDGFTIGARVLLLFQLLTVYPLLAYMLRIQLLSSIYKRVPTRSLIFLINFILVSICILFATFMPYIGTIVRYTGALSGLIYVFTLPNLLYLAILKKQQKLTICSLIFHLSIPIIGILNLIAQFFIIER